MPTAGWPIVLYAHGTGGDYRTFIGEGVAQALARVKDDAGSVVTRFAVASVDQVLHGSRAPNTSPAVTFFNLQNPAGSVHNVVQGGIDYFSLLRMIKGLSLTSVPWSPRSGRQGAKVFDPPFSFDPDNILFMGHSQGGHTSAEFVAYEPDVGAAVLSGAGGSAMLGLLNKTRPISIPVLLRTVLGEGVDELHPMVNLLQQMLETADTANYGRVVRDHRKHVLLTQGFVDHHTPNVATDALALQVVGHSGTSWPNQATVYLFAGTWPREGTVYAGPGQYNGRLVDVPSEGYIFRLYGESNQRVELQRQYYNGGTYHSEWLFRWDHNVVSDQTYRLERDAAGQWSLYYGDADGQNMQPVPIGNVSDLTVVMPQSRGA